MSFFPIVEIGASEVEGSFTVGWCHTEKSEKEKPYGKPCVASVVSHVEEEMGGRGER